MDQSLSESRLIVGLGNPGKEYEWTRHNLGFLVVRRLAERLGVKFSLSSLTNGLTAHGSWHSKEICLLMPLTFMNHSGIAVKQMMTRKSLELKDILVVGDDLSLPFGCLRLRSKGSDGGHNGLSSVIAHLKNENFPPLRLGIGEPDKSKDVVDYVLEGFKTEEKKHLDRFIHEAAECCLLWFKEGITKAMDQFNKRPSAKGGEPRSFPSKRE